MTTTLPLSISASAADRVLSDLRIKRPEEIDVELIAAHLGVSVLFRQLEHEEGRLLRSGSTGIIVVAQSARDSGRWRFVVAHELGHYVRHPKLDQFALCTDVDLESWYHASGHEIEANAFASELLMPEFIFKPQCDRNRPSLRDVRELADRFGTSITSTAIRFTRFSPEPCAVVLSKAGHVEWAARSDSFSFFIPRGKLLTSATYAGDLHNGRQVEDRPQLIDGSAWADGRELDLQEHSVMLVRFGAVLTFLWHKFK